MSSNSILQRAADYCSSMKFDKIFEEFACDHAHLFMDAAEAKVGEDVEHKHEYQACHEEYLSLFEEQIEGFIEKEDTTIEDFYAECQDAKEGAYTALFDVHEHAWFVQHLLASMEYKQFYGLMVNEARRLGRK